MNKYPDNTLEKMAVAAGAQVHCLWQQPGPKNTSIAWIECLAIDQTIVIVETFKLGGWLPLVAVNKGRVDDTVAAVLNACEVTVPTN